jgi:hypothetical protein
MKSQVANMVFNARSKLIDRKPIVRKPIVRKPIQPTIPSINQLKGNSNVHRCKYDFQIPTRTDNEVRLVYCGTLCDEENTLEIIEEFHKIHTERPEVVLKIVYDKIHGDSKFTTKVNAYVQSGVDGIIFKHNLSHRDTCYEIATSDIGICWRKDDNGEVSAKVNDYEMYGLCVCNILLNLQIYKNIDSIFDNEITGNNILILNNYQKYDCLYIKTYSTSINQSSLKIYIDNKNLQESDVLLSKNYITPNYIDRGIYPTFKCIHIHGNMISHNIICNIKPENINIEANYQLNRDKVLKSNTYKQGRIFLNNIAFIGDEFTFNSLNDIINVTYISQHDIDNIDIDKFDILLCESTWQGMDTSWLYAFNMYETEKHSNGLRRVVSSFKQKRKPCIFYNKEDPTNYEKFYKSAELFDIIITTSAKCVNKYKHVYPTKHIINMPFLCNPIIQNPINNKKEEKVYFVGGFYNHLTDRTTYTNTLLQNVISNNYNLHIINRHYFFPKLTRQISRFKYHQTKYEISEEFKKYELPSVSHSDALDTYKASLFQLNINTVNDCETMCSRRLIELLACGCNVYSNNSSSIEYLKLPVITDLNNIDKETLYKKYNLDGFYLTHINYSYISLIKDLFTLLNIPLKHNMKIKINCTNEDIIPTKYSPLINTMESDFELILNEDRYHNAESIEKLLIYPYFFDGDVCFTHDETKYFTVEDNVVSHDSIIKYYNSSKTLFIPHI